MPCLCGINIDDLGKKDYIQSAEDQSIGMASEPAEAMAYANATTAVEEDMPILGPATWEEALADIEESERDYKAGRYYAWDDVKIMIGWVCSYR